VVNLDSANGARNIEEAQPVSGIQVNDYSFIQALENRRVYFKAMGATATDHAVVSPYTVELS
jgi:glucuronate isomerase